MNFIIIILIILISMVIGSVTSPLNGILVFIIAMGIYFFATKKENEPSKNLHESKYINHCWNCGKKIDDKVDIKCPKCKKHYICVGCGKCLCDNPDYEH